MNEDDLHLLITEKEIRVGIPSYRRPGRGRAAYLLYLLDRDATWDSVSAQMGLQGNVAWIRAKGWAKKQGAEWPPRKPREGRSGRPWLKTS